jgi:hypothetical protein
MSPPFSSDELIDWREMQSLVRSMPDLHKTLVLANCRRTTTDKNFGTRPSVEGDEVNGTGDADDYTIEEIALATEHAPFRHRQNTGEVGSQKKTKMKLEDNVNKKQKTAIVADNEAAGSFEHSATSSPQLPPQANQDIN